MGMEASRATAEQLREGVTFLGRSLWMIKLSLSLSPSCVLLDLS